ncbi:hypothetical protein RBU60_11815 [Mesonia sp. MT50]|uniref:Uncharacterized protein n=1 Tax=Mesonia profundi TaxID=3070998 RepID=A0ABU1A5J8_9FLAO|nr:hypothetical protein [Mesonia profundi]MDQ7918264.1 hypothetical protein [Mesonia profundi]
MNNTQKIFIGILILGASNSCTPERIPETFSAGDNIGNESPQDPNTTPDTGDDQSQEPDNEKDG